MSPRQPRKSRARVPPLTAEERSKINSENATKHGRFAAERLLTVELCQSIVRKYAEQQTEYEKQPEIDRIRRAPREEVHPAWYEDEHLMADYVIAAYGYRVSRNQRLRRLSDRYPWEPGNIAGYEYGPPRATAARRLAAGRSADPGKLLDCLCDHRQQEACATSRSPCAWSAAMRDTAPWFEPPECDAGS